MSGPHGIVVVLELDDKLETVPERYKATPAKRKKISPQTASLRPNFFFTNTKQATVKINASYTVEKVETSPCMIPPGKLNVTSFAFCQVEIKL